MKKAALALLLLLLIGQAHAQQMKPRSDTYIMPSDVQPAGGGDNAKSNNYLLDDTIGEANIGPSGTENYNLNAGYRQSLDTFLSMNCTSTVNLGTITRTGDTSVTTCGDTGYCATNKTTCTVVTDSQPGYTLSWVIESGTGALGTRTGTGYLNGFVAGNRIAPLGTGSTVMTAQPHAMTAGGTVTNDARWAGRLSSTSTTTGGAGKNWGTDGQTDTWLRVATGSSINIASRTTRTSVAGDTEHIGFRAIIHGTAIVPNDSYKATVTVTALSN